MNATHPAFDEYGRSFSVFPIEAFTQVVMVFDSPQLKSRHQAVHSWLRSASITEAISDELWRTLQVRITCLDELSAGARNCDAAQRNSSVLHSWIAGVERAVMWINAQRGVINQISEPAVAQHDEQDRDAVLRATVWQTIFDVTAPLSVSREIRESVDSCTRQALLWCQGFPVPPGQGQPWDIECYVHICHELSQVAGALCDELEFWDDLVLEDIGDEIRCETRNASTLPNEFSTARFIVARDRLLTACRQFTDGWPVEAGTMRVALRALSNAVPATFATNSPSAGAFEPLVTRLAAVEARLSVCQRTVAAESPSPMGIGVPRASSAAKNQCISELLDIFSWMECSEVQIAAAVRTDFSQLIERNREELEPLPRPEVGRDLVSLLVDIDAHLAEQPPSILELRQLRDKLRSVLVEWFPYQILDAACLVGRPHDEVRERVRVRYAALGAANSRITNVHRPGYLFQFADGRVSVIRRAEVDVTE